jgi:hypothetical protein
VVGDDVDLMMDSAQREITFHKLEKQSRVLWNIREALSQIAGRTYGMWVLRRNTFSKAFA